MRTSGGLSQYYRNDPNGNTIQPESFKYNIEIPEKTPDAGNTKDDKNTIKILK